MPRLTTGRLRERRALNETMVYVRHAPQAAAQPPHVFLRALRGALRMSQAQLAKRCGVARSHIAAIESGRGDCQLGTLRRIFDALFCDLLVIPKPRQRPTEVLGERYADDPLRDRPWAVQT
jgi:DNA-binding XRE family transcriptional regulator